MEKVGLRTERKGGMWSRRPRAYMGCSADQKKKKKKKS
jgi:hypothetical protein